MTLKLREIKNTTTEKIWAGEQAWSAKCLLRKHKGLRSLDPSRPWKNLGMAASICNPRAGGWEWQRKMDPRAYWLTSLSELPFV